MEKETRAQCQAIDVETLGRSFNARLLYNCVI